MILLSTILFIVLVPGVLFKIPATSPSIINVAVVHGLIFGIVGFFFHDPIEKLVNRYSLTNR